MSSEETPQRTENWRHVADLAIESAIIPKNTSICQNSSHRYGQSAAPRHDDLMCDRMNQRQKHWIIQPVRQCINRQSGISENSCPGVVFPVDVLKIVENTEELSRTYHGPVLQPNSEAIVGGRINEATAQPLGNRINRAVREKIDTVRKFLHKDRVQTSLWVFQTTNRQSQIQKKIQFYVKFSPRTSK